MSEIEGVETREEQLFGCQVTTVNIQTVQAAEQLGRVVGKYITIKTPTALYENIEIAEVGECLAVILDRVLQPYYHGKLCICGMGHWSVPADALGPQTVYALPLKAFSGILKEGNFREVYAFAPGTEMTNNVHTEVIADGVFRALQADCALLVDSLAARDTSRLFQTIQLSTAGGFSPHLAGRTTAWSHLAIPVISLGVPVTIPLSALSPGLETNMMLTDIHIQDIITAASTMIAYAIMRVVWPSLSKEECFVFAKSNRDPIPYSSLFDGEKEDSKFQER